MRLHTFGDSHCITPWDKMTIDGLPIKINPIGAMTCSHFGFEKLNAVNIKNGVDIIWNIPFDVDDGDIVCFCFGEVDCRNHLGKPENFKIHRELIDDIVPKYFEAIRLNVEQFKNLTTMVFSVPPAVIFTPHIVSIGHDEIIKGSDEERRTIVLYMNSKLKEYCEKYDYIFVDVYDKYCDENGLLKLELSDLSVHIKDGIYVKEFLINKLKL